MADSQIIWLASYPKSGNTWLRILLANYFEDHLAACDIAPCAVARDVASGRALFENALGIASGDLTTDEIAMLRPLAYGALGKASTDLNWLKVHDRQERLADGTWRFPPAATRGAVYLIRDPRDVAVSNAFHDAHGDMSRSVAKLCDLSSAIGRNGGKQFVQALGDWSGHVLSWVDQKTMPVLVVRYEDMLRDTVGQLSRVITFSRPETPPEPGKLAEAVARSRMETLQQAEAAAGFSEKPRGVARFFRAGVAGGWREHLTPAQVDRLRVAHLPVMQRFGYEAET